MSTNKLQLSILVSMLASLAPAEIQVNPTLGKMPLYFIENQGQLDARISHYVQARDKVLYFTSRGVTYALNGSSVDLEFLGTSGLVRPAGHEPTPAVINYFKGPQKNWKTGLRTYSKLVYADLWPGIDLIYSGTTNQLKYSFVVKPGADPNRIRLAYRGASKVDVNDAGQLEVTTPVASFHDDAPYSYQDIGGQRVEVATSYAMQAHQYGFRLGAYDRSKTLVLDPAVLIYCGFVGGSGGDFGQGIAVDNAGNAYITGYTGSSDLPAAPGLSFKGGPIDAFVAKIKADGTGLAYIDYIGGAGRDSGSGIALDTAGNAYATGYTDSSDFPVSAGSSLVYKGKRDVFVVKVKADGTGLLYSGLIGGLGDDEGRGIAVDSAGSAYVTGVTGSSGSFPVAVGPVLGFAGSPFGFNSFVAKLKPDGTGLVYAGYISIGYGNGVAVDAAGSAYVTGSTDGTLPAVIGPDLTFNGKPGDAFVAKVKPDGTGFVYAGYIGGSGNDSGAGIAVDSAGNAYVAGNTNTSDGTFPATVGPDLTYNGGGNDNVGDAFVAKVKADGTGLIYAGYIGGSGHDYATGIAVDSAGNAYVTGVTSSSESSFPVIGGPGLYFQGGWYGGGDAFVAKVKADGTGLIYCGYIGGVNNDHGQAIALDPAGNAYITGGVESTESTFPVVVGPHLNFYGGDNDAFVAKIGLGNGRPQNGPANPNSGSGASGILQFTFADADGFADLNFTHVLLNSTLYGVNACYVFYNRSANALYLVNDGNNVALGPLVPGSAATVENSQCVLKGAGSAISGSGNTLTMTLSLSFKSGFSGAKRIFMNAFDTAGLSGGWQDRGSWTVLNPANVAPTSDSATVNPGSGDLRSFALVYSDANGRADINFTYVLFNSSLNGVNACFVFYSKGANALYLVNDANNGVLGPVVPGSATTVENSQCVLDGSGSYFSAYGVTTETLQVLLRFKPAFGGTKTIYMNAFDIAGLSSGWQSRGTWTVPTVDVAPTADAVTPNTGSGSARNFSLTYSDGNGYADLDFTYVLFNSALNGVNGCFVFYNRPSNSLYLVNDANNVALGPVTPGSGTSAENSQCVLNGAGTVISGIGNTLTVGVSINFKSAFAGPKTVFMNAVDRAGVSSGWQSRGTWTVP